MPKISITQTTIEADTDEGVYVTHVVLFFTNDVVTNYLEIRTDFYPN